MIYNPVAAALACSVVCSSSGASFSRLFDRFQPLEITISECAVSLS